MCVCVCVFVCVCVCVRVCLYYANQIKNRGYNIFIYYLQIFTASFFDVTMGSLDGTEMCELVGLYIVSLPQKRVNKKDNGLHRNDGLVVSRNANGRTIDLCRKDITSIFETLGFNINIQTNLKIVNFSDVTFSLENGTY